jgi:NifU-like protein
VSAIYPNDVLRRLKLPANAGSLENVNATGKAVSFECGTSITFEMLIDKETKLIQSVAFRSNGCGFMIGAADVVADEFGGRHLTDLHALTDLPDAVLLRDLGEFPVERRQCGRIAITAFKNALADFRRRQVEEFSGEKGLICTCFGVTEETIELAASERSARTVDEVGRVCRAGTGCGSCQLMIQEIIDSVCNAG